MAEEDPHSPEENEETYVKPKPSRSSSSCKMKSKSETKTDFSFNYEIWKLIPIYISCFFTTSSVFVISCIFCFHCYLYLQLHISFALIFILSVTSVTFVGTFKCIT